MGASGVVEAQRKAPTPEGADARAADDEVYFLLRRW
jgi:hypothetical protein